MEISDFYITGLPEGYACEVAGTLKAAPLNTELII